MFAPSQEVQNKVEEQTLPVTYTKPSKTRCNAISEIGFGKYNFGNRVYKI